MKNSDAMFAFTGDLKDEPRAAITAAMLMHPSIKDFACEVGKVLERYGKEYDAPLPALLIMAAAVTGFGLGDCIDSTKPGAEESAKAFGEVLNSILTFSVEDSFAKNKDHAHG
jgi:hypothetical protein